MNDENKNLTNENLIEGNNATSQVNENNSQMEANPQVMASTVNTSPILEQPNPIQTIPEPVQGSQPVMSNVNNVKDKGRFKLALIFSSFATPFLISFSVMKRFNPIIGILVLILAIFYMFCCCKWMKRINEQQERGYLKSETAPIAFAITFGTGIAMTFVFSVVEIIFSLLLDNKLNILGATMISASPLMTWIPMLISMFITSKIKKQKTN